MKKIYGGLFAFVLVVISFLCYELYHDNNKYLVENSSSKSIVNNGNTISIMLETSSGSGEYQESSSSSWPTDLIFNSKLSKCTNGGEISWDATNKKVVVKSSSVDNCYAYFDVISLTSYCSNGSNLASCIKNFADAAGSSNSKIYHHDSSLTNGASDNSYRYSGANPNNYVCFGSNESPCPTDNLYRIIGVFGDKVKLIKSDYATSALLGTDGDYSGSAKPNASSYKGSLTTVNTYKWNYKATNNGSNTWSTSLLNKTNLNTNFITNIGTEWANKIATTTWKVGGNTSANIRDVVPATTYQNEIVNPVTTNTTDNATEYPAKIGLMYASDYGFAADPSAWTKTLYDYDGIKSLNWMYMGGYTEWTISRSSGNAYNVFLVNTSGYVNSSSASNAYVVRPSFSLESSVTYASGSGSADDPIRIG